ncbi:MAG: hypothetical protein HC840_03125 [Leptolyngbyaceae cyanobacterium RM2_2_4]|nr:hypothetical protein [Leptolyngbyaceae cyanobacterium SM1_4_3]NJN90687.1 hypothetical protein [Leptolyngbyaceae cyanobacterium SL_5_14]NJO48629.1 hypothetical protein [Leptolyngbyaceae cyanobacterium RM2_2_4]
MNAYLVKVYRRYCRTASGLLQVFVGFSRAGGLRSLNPFRYDDMSG